MYEIRNHKWYRYDQEICSLQFEKQAAVSSQHSTRISQFSAKIFNEILQEKKSCTQFSFLFVFGIVIGFNIRTTAATEKSKQNTNVLMKFRTATHLYKW